MVGFRFPPYAEGIEVGGYHLHFIGEDRSRGGHVLSSRAEDLRVRLDPPTTSTLSCRRGLTWPIPTWPPRPMRLSRRLSDDASRVCRL
jgi:Alpha-acetolactate decarboxylase